MENVEVETMGERTFNKMMDINKELLPSIDQFMYVEIYDLEKKPVKSFKFGDWKKATRELLGVKNSVEFDEMGIIKHNFITHLDKAGFFIDISENGEDVEVYKRGSVSDKFLLADWRTKLDLIGTTEYDVEQLDHNKYIGALFEKQYSLKKAVAIDKDSLKEERKIADEKYKNAIKDLVDGFINEFMELNDISLDETRKLYNLSKKYIFDNGFVYIEELMNDFLTYAKDS